MQKIFLLLPLLMYQGLVFRKFTITINCKINNVAAQFKKMYFTSERVISTYKERQEKIKKTHFKFLVVFPTYPLGFGVKNILRSLKDFFLLSLEALFSVILG